MAILDDSQRKAFQAEKFTILEGLIRGFGHELNNPLTAIMGYTQLLSSTVEDEEALEFLRYIEEQADRCRKIIDNMVEFAHKDKSVKRSASINQIITELLTLKKAQLLKKNIDIQLHFDEELPNVVLDVQQFKYVFLKVLMLVHQALEEKREGARIIRIRTRSHGDHIDVQFIDNSKGIDSEKLKGIFDQPPSGQDDEKGGELRFCMDVIQEHGSTIKVLSKIGRGTKVKIEIPLAAAKEKRKEAQPEKKSAPPAGEGKKGAKILVVDDEPPVRTLLEEILHHFHYQVSTAASGEEALEVLEEDDVDLIIADLNMPGIGYRTLYERILNRKPHLQQRIVFTTGDSVSEDNKEFLKEAGRPFLPKPFNVIDVKNMVEKLLRGEPVPLKALL